MTEDGGLHRVTLCADCDFIHDRKIAPEYQLCTRHPRLPSYDRFVTADAHEKAPPFLRASIVNGGICHLFAPKRDGQMSLATGGK